MNQTTTEPVAGGEETPPPRRWWQVSPVRLIMTTATALIGAFVLLQLLSAILPALLPDFVTEGVKDLPSWPPLVWLGVITIFLIALGVNIAGTVHALQNEGGAWAAKFAGLYGGLASMVILLGATYTLTMWFLYREDTWSVMESHRQAVKHGLENYFWWLVAGIGLIGLLYLFSRGRSSAESAGGGSATSTSSSTSGASSSWGLGTLAKWLIGVIVVVILYLNWVTVEVEPGGTASGYVWLGQERKFSNPVGHCLEINPRGQFSFRSGGLGGWATYLVSANERWWEPQLATARALPASQC